MQFPLFLFGPVHLPGMAVTPLHDERSLAQTLKALAQADAGPFGQPDQNAAGLVVQSGIGGKGDGLSLHRGIDVDPLQMLLGHVLFALCRGDGDLEQFLHSLGTNPFAPLDQCRRIKGEPVLKVFKTAKVLPVGVFEEPFDH